MNAEEELHTRELTQRLAEAEATIQALLSDQIDAVVDARNGTPVLLARAQEALRESEERFREQAALLDIAQDAIYVRNLEGYITYWNKAAEQAYGWTAAEAVGRRAVELLCTEPSEFRDAESALLLNGAWQGETARRTNAGRPVTMAVRWTLVRDAQGRPTSILAINTDITERNLAVDALREAEERMRFALQGADVGIWDMDCVTQTVQWSAILEEQYGLKTGAFGGTMASFVERIHPDDREAALATVGAAMKAGGDFSLLHRTICDDGTVRWMSGAGRVQLGEDGNALRAVGISLNVTERHMLEEQFHRAQKMEAIGQLAAGVAHDFNNLLTAILGYCDLLLTDVGSEDPRREDIAEIQKAGTRAAGLTRQLLAFSRKQIIEPKVLDLNVLVAGIQPMLGRLLGDDVTLVARLGAAPQLVKADHGQVEQVVMNLAVNARDAMPKGGTLTIETGNVELDEHFTPTRLAVKPGPYVVLTVTDTGSGITPEVQARLFEPFFTTKGPGKGTGLGLATVYGIVTQSGGSVGIYSEIGRGTSFKVYFPRADAAEMIVVAPPSPARAHVGNHTVLVVEDAEGLRLLARRLLQRDGHTVLVAADADEALRIFESNPSINVVLTDIVMPGLTGPDLAQLLVAIRPSLKVIFMSGYTEAAVVHDRIINPGISFLHKPFSADALSRKVRELFDR